MTVQEDTQPSIAEAATALPTERLEAELVACAGGLASRTYELLVLVGEYDARGCWALTARLQPHVAAQITATIDHAVMANRAPAGASLAHQRADALHTITRSGGGSITTEVVIHVDHTETGCHCRTLLQADHTTPYPAGGNTVIDNLTNRCGPHNRRKSEGPC